MAFRFILHKVDKLTGARRGEFVTSHGTVQTPVFMPVGTMATVKTLSTPELESLGTEIILGNTYHLLLRPGPEVFRKLGGIHKFMGWTKPVLTDSGGFQIFSLPRARKMTEEGAIFQSYVQGHQYKLSPEISIDMQNAIGSDIMMVLDQCIDSTSDHGATKKAMELTHRWALRSLSAANSFKNRDDNPHQQALFGIIQGGVFTDLRNESLSFLTQHAFDGFAIGGLAVGETKAQREDFCELVARKLPSDKPRYLMGVGTPIDLLEAVRRGVDMFDCIIPTKLAQQGVVYTSQGEIKLAQLEYKFSDEKIDPQCDCWSCKRYSRAYMHHLVKCREALAWRALSLHNVHFYHRLMEGMRSAIEQDNFMNFYRQKISEWNHTEQNHETMREAPLFVPPPKRDKQTFTEPEILG